LIAVYFTVMVGKRKDDAAANNSSPSSKKRREYAIIISQAGIQRNINHTVLPAWRRGDVAECAVRIRPYLVVW
jgi:hypothetical protein